MKYILYIYIYILYIYVEVVLQEASLFHYYMNLFYKMEKNKKAHNSCTDYIRVGRYALLMTNSIDVVYVFNS